MDSSRKIALHKFSDMKLFTEALTHTSYCYENPMTGYHNERLEFLGDSVISCVVTDYIYNKFTKYKEGTLTQLRARIVCQDTLAKFSRDLGLDKKLRLGKGSSAMRNNEKVLCDTFEAYVGAIFLDVNKDLVKVMDHIKQLIEPFVDYLKEVNASDFKDEDDGIISIEDDEVPVEEPAIPSTHAYEDPIGKLQMWVAKRDSKKVPLYDIEEKTDEKEKIFVATVRIDGEIVGRGEGLNKKSAKKRAAEDAMEKSGIKGPTS
ncbi:15415_t:CDS:1 [Acaulospora colombiana]|uniref:15415_t:CDS:1 n=1 Tax=Acaulospora colombiana TaxID=27376 RepID=A0ACA9K1L6_9GLOM|nr:15415_t:CDS:1 [Acaulospora colombiana]